jgi:uncharacterized protein
MYDGPVIDCDVHHDWPTQEHLLPYLSQGWQEYVVGPSRTGGRSEVSGKGLLPFTTTQMWPNPTGVSRADAFPPDGGAAASDYELLREQLLEPNRMKRVVLQYAAAGFVGSLPNPYFASEVARAANDWSIDNWLSRDDDRLYGAVLVASQIPDGAAAEIRRVGSHPRMCEVLLCSTGLGKPFGHPAYHPMYEAAEEVDIAIAIHSGGEVFPGNNVSPLASGMPSFYFENSVLTFQGMMTHLTSFITHGVFEKFPRLRLLIVEGGVSWVPGLLWRLDAAYKGLRRELPWVKRFPSEYFYDHVRVATQPLERSPEPEQLIELLKLYGGEDVLCFSTDYPHWDTDEKDYIATRLPAEWQPKIFFENAARFYRWDELLEPDRGQVPLASASSPPQ